MNVVRLALELVGDLGITHYLHTERERESTMAAGMRLNITNNINFKKNYYLSVHVKVDEVIGLLSDIENASDHNILPVQQK